MEDPKTKAIIYGVFAMIAVIMINFIVLALLNYPPMAINLINKYILLIAFLILGFGFQVGLFTYYHSMNVLSCSTTVASGGISAISMILCCSHYLLTALPFLGTIAGLSFLTYLSDYTLYVLLFGIFSNIIGIIVIFYQNKNFKGGIKMEKDKVIFIILMIVLALSVIVVFYNFTAFNKIQSSGSSGNMPQECRTPAGQDVESWKEHLGHHENTKYCLEYYTEKK